MLCCESCQIIFGSFFSEVVGKTCDLEAVVGEVQKDIWKNEEYHFTSFYVVKTLDSPVYISQQDLIVGQASANCTGKDQSLTLIYTL